MTRGSNTPLTPPLEDLESAFHKKKDKEVVESATPKKSPFKDLKLVFRKNKDKHI